MTHFTPSQIAQMKRAFIGQTITDFDHEPDGDYFVMKLGSGAATAFRFMADLVRSDEP